MFQPYIEHQGRSAFFLGLKATGGWIVHLAIFAGLLWLSAWMKVQTSAAGLEPPQKTETMWTDPLPDVPPVSDDPRCSWPRDEVIPFTSSMTRPVLISGAPLQYPAEALAANLRGVIIARCTLTCLGEVKSCRIIKRLPFMDQAVITMLESRRYVPVHYQGRPVTVSYNFLIRLPQP